MLSKTLCLKSLICVIDAPSLSIRICSKTVLSLLSIIMTDADRSLLQLKDDEASRLVELLHTTTKDGEASEKFLTYTTVELLVTLCKLSSLSGNKVSMIKAGIVEPLKLLVLDGDYKVQEKSLSLLWILLSDTQLSTRIITDHQELCLMLRYIQESPSIILSRLAHSVLKMIFWDDPEGKHPLIIVAI